MRPSANIKAGSLFTNEVQGNELWDFSLVDPDNRRPVDYALRMRLLDGLEPWLGGTGPKAATDGVDTVAEMLEHWEDGRIKLLITTLGLRLRRRLRLLFLEGDYVPLEAEGERANHVVAQARQRGSEFVVAIVPRLVAGLPSSGKDLPIGEACWAGTRLRLSSELGGSAFHDLLTGERIQTVTQEDKVLLPVAAALRTCPIALLAKTSPRRRSRH